MDSHDAMLPTFGPREFAAGLRTFARIADRWNLTADQRAKLLGITADRLDHLLAADDPEVDAETLVRISHILAIWRLLQTLFSSKPNADTWLTRPNTNALFGGLPAVNLMMTGKLEDIVKVRGYLAAEAGGDW